MAPSASSHNQMQRLLEAGVLWRGQRSPAVEPVGPEGLPSGFAALDAELTGGGWPRAGLAEVLCDGVGFGEQRLLLPALARLCAEARRWLLWIDPPHTPYAPALAAAGIDPDRVLLVRATESGDARAAAWTLEQALESGACAAVLAWADERLLSMSVLRRLQLRARHSGTLAVLFRPLRARLSASAAELRLALTPSADAVSAAAPTARQPSGRPLASDPGQSLDVEILKRRGGWPLAGLTLRLNENPDADWQRLLQSWRHQVAAR